jgi:hypothetical protein
MAWSRALLTGMISCGTLAESRCTDPDPDLDPDPDPDPAPDPGPDLDLGPDLTDCGDAPTNEHHGSQATR